MIQIIFGNVTGKFSKWIKQTFFIKYNNKKKLYYNLVIKLFWNILDKNLSERL